MTPTNPLQTPSDALSLLAALGAPRRLILHHELVTEAATEMLAGLGRALPRLPFAAAEFLVGAALHDAGKIAFPAEMTGPGARHEREGEAFLRARGVPAHLARFCRTHARWKSPESDLTDRLVALSDTLWKGKRLPDLEELVRNDLAAALGLDPWSLDERLDALWESVAAGGPDRLARSH
jgi:hypothetical protein